jgi:hypothetical protein
MDTFSPGLAQPQILIGVFLCNIILSLTNVGSDTFAFAGIAQLMKSKINMVKKYFILLQF